MEDTKTTKRFDRLEKLINSLAKTTESRFNRLERLVDGLAISSKRNFDGIDDRLDRIDLRLESVENKVVGIGRRIDREADERAQLERRVAALE